MNRNSLQSTQLVFAAEEKRLKSNPGMKKKIKLFCPYLHENATMEDPSNIAKGFKTGSMKKPTHPTVLTDKLLLLVGLVF